MNWYAIGEVKYFLGQTTWVLKVDVISKIYTLSNSVFYTRDDHVAPSDSSLAAVVGVCAPIIQSCSKSYPLYFP